MNSTSAVGCEDLELLVNASFVHRGTTTPVLVANSQMDKIFLLLSATILALSIVIGGAGNIVILSGIFTVKKLRIPPNIQLASLALVDLAACVIASPVRLYNVVQALNGTYNICSRLTRILCYVEVFTIRAFIVASLLHLTSISIMRVVIVRGHQSIGRRHMQIAIVMVMACSLCGIGNGAYSLLRAPDRICMMFFALEGATDRLMPGFLPMLCLAGFLVIAVCYGLIYRETRRSTMLVHAHGVPSQVVGGQNGHNMATTRICLAIVVSFFILYMPYSVAYVMHLGGHGKFKASNPFLVTFSFTLGIADSAINPLLYAFQSKELRKALKNAVRSRLSIRNGITPQREQPNVSARHASRVNTNNAQTSYV
ncbi:neuromedin-U receptor 1-like [Ptychodera flava]|uniref:neuromedin-U receptor 1-like n=1 Tax=Ptychodera flava TaxID=63121 RepID=UPI00396AA635